MIYEQYDPAKSAAKIQTLTSLGDSIASLTAIENQLGELVSKINYAISGSATGCDKRCQGYCETAKANIRAGKQSIERARGIVGNLSEMTYVEVAYE